MSSPAVSPGTLWVDAAHEGWWNSPEDGIGDPSLGLGALPTVCAMEFIDGPRATPRHDPQHVARAQQAIALITAFVGVQEHGSLKAAGLLNDLLAEDNHPEYLLSAVAAIGAVLVRDLAKATGTTPEEHLQALGRAAALLQLS